MNRLEIKYVETTGKSIFTGMDETVSGYTIFIGTHQLTGLLPLYMIKEQLHKFYTYRDIKNFTNHNIEDAHFTIDGVVYKYDSENLPEIDDNEVFFRTEQDGVVEYLTPSENPGRHGLFDTIAFIE